MIEDCVDGGTGEECRRQKSFIVGKKTSSGITSEGLPNELCYHVVNDRKLQ